MSFAPFFNGLLMLWSLLIVFAILAWFIGMGGAVIVIVLVVIGVFIVLILQSQTRRAGYEKVIEDHVDALALKKKQLVVANDYGIKDTAQWEREKRKFISSVVSNRLGAKVAREEMTSIGDAIDRRVAKQHARLPATRESGYVADMSPIQYEKWCASQLRACGWRADLTPATGDQGADVIATKDGRRVVIQCKHYKRTVGNKAVQEVHAAKGFYEAELAVVVTNSGLSHTQMS